MDAASAASAHLHDTTVMSAPQPIDHVVVLHTAQPDPRRRRRLPRHYCATSLAFPPLHPFAVFLTRHCSVAPPHSCIGAVLHDAVWLDTSA